jgi:hypothetical protein
MYHRVVQSPSFSLPLEKAAPPFYFPQGRPQKKVLLEWINQLIYYLTHTGSWRCLMEGDCVAPPLPELDFSSPFST